MAKLHRERLRPSKCLAAAVALLAFGIGIARAAPPATTEHGGFVEETPAHETTGHPEHAEHEPEPINWYYGFFGERDGVQPSFAWRPKGMPPPLGAMLFNTAVLFYVIGRVGAPKLSEGLKKRRSRIMAGFDEAARMKSDAEKRLDEYTEKLERINEDIERVKREMHEAGEAERTRILAEAREKRTRMERDAQLLIEQELKAARELLLRETVDAAVRSAEELLSKQVTPTDQQRMVDEYLKELPRAVGGPKS